VFLGWKLEGLMMSEMEGPLAGARGRATSAEAMVGVDVESEVERGLWFDDGVYSQGLKKLKSARSRDH
jgi:hypothetical protein